MPSATLSEGTLASCIGGLPDYFVIVNLSINQSIKLAMGRHTSDFIVQYITCCHGDGTVKILTVELEVSNDVNTSNSSGVCDNLCIIPEEYTIIIYTNHQSKLKT